jgi:DNA-directed RNA polymerase subunit omega
MTEKEPEQPTPAPDVDSKFRLVLVAANRAEQIMRGARPKVESGKQKPTRVAMHEVAQNLVDWGYGPAPVPVEEAAAEGEAQEQPVPEVH